MRSATIGIGAVDILPQIAAAWAHGRDLITDSSAEGGIIVSPEILDMAADMEIVAEISYKGNYPRFNQALLMEIKRAEGNGDDPLDEVRLWLDEHLSDEQTLSS